MSDAKYETTTVTLEADAAGRARRSPRPAPSTPSRASSRRTKRGATRSAATPTAPTTSRSRARRRRRARPRDIEPKGHATSPKPRYTEASLVKALEEKGIGRPSTFASIIDTIIDRGYVTKRGQALVPSWLAFSVVRLLEQHFADLVDYDFTAALEDDLDAIARGEQRRSSG
jgi:DNA topoisomerase-1